MQFSDLQTWQSSLTTAFPVLVNLVILPKYIRRSDMSIAASFPPTFLSTKFPLLL